MSAETTPELSPREQMEARRKAYADAVDLFEALPDAQRRAIREHIKTDLEGEGWHDEDECDPCDRGHDDSDHPELTAADLAARITGELTDWHDKAHGLTLITTCSQEPCRSVVQQIGASLEAWV